MSAMLPTRLPALVIDVAGAPVQQGSKRIGRNKAGQPIILDDNDVKLKRWRKTVTAAARTRCAIARHSIIDGPCAVTIRFYLERPAAARRRAYPHTRPDVDKLARAVLDALTDAEVFTDDSRVVDLHVRKIYAAEPRLVGAWIMVTPL